jgi:hypothetical protein
MLRSLGSALVLALTAPSAASAIPPPPPVAVVLVAPQGLEEDAGRLLQSIGTGGAWFEMTTAPIAEEAFADCANGEEPDVCVRSVLAGVEQERPPVVVVMVSTGPGFHVAWRCIGPGEAPAHLERQVQTFDTLAWRNAATLPDNDRQAAAGCILAAASESGW